MIKRFALVLSLSLAVAALAAACGDDGYSSGASTTVPTKAGSAVSPAPEQASVKVAQAGTLGQVLTAPDGRTLYTFTQDTPGSGKSVCNGACAQNWPPLTMSSGQPVKPQGLAGDLSLVTRDDGTKQVAYNGRPLYFYAKDSAPGDTNGQGVGNVWYVAQPSATAASGGGTPQASVDYGNY